MRKSERSRRHSDTSVPAQGPQDGQHLPHQGGRGEGGGLRHLQDARLCQQGRPDRAGYTLLHQPRDGRYPFWFQSVCTHSGFEAAILDQADGTFSAALVTMMQQEW